MTKSRKVIFRGPKFSIGSTEKHGDICRYGLHNVDIKGNRCLARDPTLVEEQVR